MSRDDEGRPAAPADADPARMPAGSASLLPGEGGALVASNDRLKPASACTPSRGFRSTALIIAGALFMQNLDATVLGTALPTIARDFEVSLGSVGFALTSYLLALAVFIPASGPLADRFGARLVLEAAIAIFLLGSIACGLSGDLTILVAARFVQGIGGAMMVPVGRLVLLRTVAKRDLVSATSWFTMPGLVGPIIGPPVGGLIATYLDWRWIFWINVPLGILGTVVIHRFIADVKPQDAVRFDWRGFIVSAIALSATLFGLQLAARPGFRVSCLPLLAVGIVATAGYVAHARRTKNPILDLELLGFGTFRLSLVGGTLLRIMQGAQPYLLPIMMQFAFGLNAAKSGVVTLAPAVGAFAMKVAARSVLRRFGFRACLLTIGVLAPLSFAITGFFRPGWPWSVVLASLVASGFLASLQFTAYNAIAYDEISPARMSAATSFYTTFQQLALSLGVCSASAVLGLATTLRGRTLPLLDDFSIAIWSVAAIALAATFVNLRCAEGAGSELSGHRGVYTRSATR